MWKVTLELVVDDDYANVWWLYDDDSWLNYDLLIVWTQILDNATGGELIDLNEGVLLHCCWWIHMLGDYALSSLCLYVHAS